MRKLRSTEPSKTHATTDAGIKLNSAFCTLDIFAPAFPDHWRNLTQAQILQKSRDGRFSPYAKYGSERSTPIFKKTDVAGWFVTLFGVSHPDAVQALFDLDDGFTVEAGQFKGPKPKRRGATSRKKNIKVRREHHASEAGGDNV